MNYYIQHIKEKKLNATTTRMQSVTIYNDKLKEIGTATVSKWQNKDTVADMLIRDYLISKAWNR